MSASSVRKKMGSSKSDDNIKSKEIPEISISYNTNGKVHPGALTSSRSTYDFLKTVYPSGGIELQERFIVLYLNRANKILGYYNHAIGGITGVTTDVRLIYATALASASSGIIISHNHPSGNLQPSQADIDLTRKVKEAGRLLDITLLDHLILTINGYYSFADEGRI
ncbi:RadC family protein [Ohtaekwangia kribbensis]|jgi:DNA repair protein RadC|uniref:RadC family protein n=1 Tax=Ohtaekwangia kribbensis TaxID=688913 RepID=A0ABW3JY17_9BACT